MTLAALPAERSALSLALLFALAASPLARAEFQATPGLAIINAQYAYARGLDGRGQAIGVSDSGVHIGHPELAGRVFAVVMQGRDKSGKLCETGRYLAGDNACFRTDGLPMVMYTESGPALAKVSTEQRSELERDTLFGRYETHGTHVAGTMVAARNGKGVQGVAPEARLFSLTPFSNVYQNLEFALELPGEQVLSLDAPAEAMRQAYAALAQAKVRAVNHSWGFDDSVPDSEAHVERQFRKYAERIEPIAAATLETKLIQVWAAGNNSGAISDISGSLPRYIPALEPYWLSVVSAGADGKLDEFSSRCGMSRNWCVAAPGNETPSSVISGLAAAQPVRDAQGRVVGVDVAAQQHPVSGTGPESGTSMSAPHVTASLALLMQRFPYLQNAAIRDVLLTTARDLGEPGIDDTFGWGMIDLRKAIEGPGQLRVDMTVNMDRPGGGTPVWSGPAWDDWRNAIGGSGRLMKRGPGWLRLSGNNRFGGATIDGGTLEFSADNALSAPVAVNAGGSIRVSGQMTGSALGVNGGSAWIGGDVNGADIHLQQGARLHLPGRLRGNLGLSASAADIAGTVHGNVALRDRSSLQLGATGVVGNGGLQLAASRARIDGRVDGRVDVDAPSRLEGNGQVGPTWMAGTVAPGHSIGTLTIAGNYVQQPGSVYEAELDPGGRSDLLQVQGQAQLHGGTLRLLPVASGSRLGQQWRILSAHGVAGRFAAVDGTLPTTPFLALTARYAGDSVHAQISRGLPLASAARTPNQRSVANAVDQTPDAHALPQRLTQLQPAQVPAALDPLSGELHASVRSLLLQDSQWLRDAALARARDGQDAFSAQSAAGNTQGLWADIHQGQRRLDGDGNADTAELSGSTALVGYDHAFDNG